ncbi:hypothetical protein [Chachezhania antarctica]|uniref:hypothetical protein n=1 Tax=Chachezhania antarctica TaxID=2340860 RepID=UPI000EABCEAD|nr:hypothetical protein [Chachezhania antarctica]
MEDPAPFPKQAPDKALGIYDRSSRAGGGGREGFGLLFTILWLGAWIGYFVLVDPVWRQSMAGLSAIVVVLAAVLPLIGTWALIGMLRAQDEIREDSQKLQEALAAIRQASIARQQRQTAGFETKLARKIDDLAERMTSLELALAATQAVPEEDAHEPEVPEPDPYADADDPDMHAALDALDAEPAPAPAPKETAAPAPSQGSLALGLPMADAPRRPETDDFLRALNFPETVDDAEGFAALRRVMRDRHSSQLIQAAEDVLTLLGQEGIYTDELRPDMARPEVWRLFAKGARGRTVADLGGIHDREVLAQVALRMRQDAIFRDAAHHFLRLFDRAAAEFEPTASDAEMSAFGNTRSARAFMIFARAAGTFD